MILAMEPAIPPDPQLVRQLAEASLALDGSGADTERNCWMVVHRHVHGFLPVEYDIREIPEDLYLAVLAARRGEKTGGVEDSTQA
jgi:hypothetical protein